LVNPPAPEIAPPKVESKVCVSIVAMPLLRTTLRPVSNDAAVRNVAPPEMISASSLRFVGPATSVPASIDVGPA
jgi:hypothetical protein